MLLCKVKHGSGGEGVHVSVRTLAEVEVIMIEYHYEFKVLNCIASPPISQEGAFFANECSINSLSYLNNDAASITTKSKAFVFIYAIHDAIVGIDGRVVHLNQDLVLSWHGNRLAYKAESSIRIFD